MGNGFFTLKHLLGHSRSFQSALPFKSLIGGREAEITGHCFQSCFSVEKTLLAPQVTSHTQRLTSKQKKLHSLKMFIGCSMSVALQFPKGSECLLITGCYTVTRVTRVWCTSAVVKCSELYLVLCIC